MKKEGQSILDVEYLENRYVGKWVMKICMAGFSYRMAFHMKPAG
jgi:hypothetical protein